MCKIQSTLNFRGVICNLPKKKEKRKKKKKRTIPIYLAPQKSGKRLKKYNNFADQLNPNTRKKHTHTHTKICKIIIQQKRA